MKTFKNIANLVAAKRTTHPKKYSREELSTLLGLKTANLISKIEAANCSVPLKSLAKLSSVLGITPDEFKEAIMRDHEESLSHYFKSRSISKASK